MKRSHTEAQPGKLQETETPTNNQGKPSEATKGPEKAQDLEEFLTFDTENGPTKIEKVAEENEDETYMDVDFEMDGQKVSARISSSMVEVLKQDESLRQQLVEKLLAEGDTKEPVFITTERPIPPSTVPTAPAQPSPQTPTVSSTQGPHRTRLSTGAIQPSNIASKLLEEDDPFISKSMKPLPDFGMSKTMRPLPDLGMSRTTRLLPDPVNSKPVRSLPPSTLRRFPKLNGAKNIANSVNKVTPVNKIVAQTSAPQRAVVIEDDSLIPSSELIWDRYSIMALIECYREVTGKLKTVKPDETVWKWVCKKMEKKGFPHSKETCEKKFIALSKAYNARMRHKATTGIDVPWIYGKPMEGLLLQEEECVKTPKSVKNGGLNDDYDLSSTLSMSSEDEDFGEDEDFDELASKKKRVSSTETWGIELFRRTYLKVETAKLKEMREMRKVQKRQASLQAERNDLLRTIAGLLKKPE